MYQVLYAKDNDARKICGLRWHVLHDSEDLDECKNIYDNYKSKEYPFVCVVDCVNLEIVCKTKNSIE